MLILKMRPLKLENCLILKGYANLTISINPRLIIAVCNQILIFEANFQAKLGKNTPNKFRNYLEISNLRMNKI